MKSGTGASNGDDRAPGANLIILHTLVYRCVHAGLRARCRIRCPYHTLTMLVLSAFTVLNLLALMNLLWAAGVMPAPYRAVAASQHHVYIWAVAIAALEANAVAARCGRRRAALLRGRSSIEARGRQWSRRYLIGSLVLYGLTLLLAWAVRG